MATSEYDPQQEREKAKREEFLREEQRQKDIEAETARRERQTEYRQVEERRQARLEASKKATRSTGGFHVAGRSLLRFGREEPARRVEKSARKHLPKGLLRIITEESKRPRTSSGRFKKGKKGKKRSKSRPRKEKRITITESQLRRLSPAERKALSRLLR